MADNAAVELDIFSGMPNPAWTLQQAEATEFQRRLEALPPAAAGRIENNLGYRGFVVRSGGTTVLVQRGLARVTREGGTLLHTDSGRELERWLLRTGKPFVDAETFALAERELGK
ncbi:hypothetical protein [Amycolatopsis sp. lyj-90]|uniref:hypothetical protein n=1 Tax=Amycolatopsis sp. lyj-90 TaxID=2789285 RepID=UPI003978E26C